MIFLREPPSLFVIVLREAASLFAISRFIVFAECGIRHTSRSKEVVSMKRHSQVLDGRSPKSAGESDAGQLISGFNGRWLVMQIL
jgi:hypothetical protein